MKAIGTVEITVGPTAVNGYITASKSPLTAEDRCDRCGAQAWVSVEMKDSDLLFCNHHFLRHKEVLLKVAYWIRDYTGAINA